MMKTIQLLVVLLAAVTFWGCEEEITVTPATYSRIFTGETSKTWRMKAIQILEDGKPTGSFLVPDDCAFDDLFIFHNNPEKLFIVDNNTQKCNEDEPQEIARDTWSFVNASATLEMIVPILADFKLPFIVKSVDERDMTTEIFFQGGSYRFVYEVVSIGD